VAHDPSDEQEPQQAAQRPDAMTSAFIDPHAAQPGCSAELSSQEGQRTGRIALSIDDVFILQRRFLMRKDR